jgi:hypothetical protein
VRLADGTNVLRSSGSVPMTADGPGALRNDFVDGAGADRLRGARGSDILLGGGADPIDTVICEVFPFVESGPKRARLDDRGRATLTLHCLATAVKRCTGTLTLQRRTPGEAGTIGSRRCTVAFGDTATVRVRLARSARRAIADNQKLRAITRSREAAGHKWTSKRTLTLVR